MVDYTPKQQAQQNQWSALRDTVAPEYRELFDEEGGIAFTPMGDAVEAMLAAIQDSEEESVDLGPHLQNLGFDMARPGARQQWFGSIAEANKRIGPDDAMRKRLYESARQYQLGHLGNSADPNTRIEQMRGLEQLLLGATRPTAGQEAAAAANIQPTPTATPTATLGPLDMKNQEMWRVMVESNQISLEDAIKQGYRPELFQTPTPTQTPMG
jgi:hypothetical protein